VVAVVGDEVGWLAIQSREDEYTFVKGLVESHDVVVVVVLPRDNIAVVVVVVVVANAVAVASFLDDVIAGAPMDKSVVVAAVVVAWAVVERFGVSGVPAEGQVHDSIHMDTDDMLDDGVQQRPDDDERVSAPDLRRAPGTGVPPTHRRPMHLAVVDKIPIPF